jgi:predicted PurR-regulated permease PerM
VAVGLFLLLLALLGAGVAALEPRLARESRALAAHFPAVMRDLFSRITGGQQIEIVGATLDADSLAAATGSALAGALDTPTDVLRVAERVLQVTLQVVVFLIALLYFLVDGPRIGAYLLRFVPPARQADLERTGEAIHVRLGRYVRGQLLLVALMALVSWLVLHFVFHVRYALAIAVATGFLEIIPFLGPIAATSLAASLALTQSGLQVALGVVVAYLVLRQIEDQLVMPLVLGRAVELHPLVIMFAVLAGERIAGVLGMLLAVPIAAAAKVLLDLWGTDPPTSPVVQAGAVPAGAQEPAARAPRALRRG